MSSVFQKNGEWYVEYRDTSTQRVKRRKLFTTANKVPKSKQTRAEAQRRARAIVEGDLSQAGTEPLPLMEFASLAIQEPGVPKVGAEISPATRRRRKDFLEPFFMGLPNALPLSSINHRHVEAYLQRLRLPPKSCRFCKEDLEAKKDRLVCPLCDRRYKSSGLSPRSVSYAAAVIKRAFNYAIESRIVPDTFKNPVVRRIRSATIATQRERYLVNAFTEHEVTVIRGALDTGYSIQRVCKDGVKRTWKQRVPDHLHLILRIALETGMRSGEIRGLRWASIDFSRGACGMIAVAGSSSKSGHRQIPMTHELSALLKERWLRKQSPWVVTNDRGSPITYAISGPVIRLLKNLGIRDKNLKSCRHTFALRALAAGVRINELAAIMGHSSIQTTQIYLQPQTETYSSEFVEKMSNS